MVQRNSGVKFNKQGWTRRQFLKQVGAAGGTAAVYESMTAMGLINKPVKWDGPPRIPYRDDHPTVLILGAGVGGLTAAYELTKSGYECTILEAQSHPGGRSLTVRNGDQVIQDNNPTQTCQFDDGLYLNMGPGRLPYHHRRVLYYCRELGVSLESYIMNSSANLFQTDKAFGTEAQFHRNVAADTRGYISELLAKSIRGHALDALLDPGDQEKLLDLLKTFGDLGAAPDCDEYDYCGSRDAGCRFPSSVYQACEPTPPLGLGSLLQSNFWKNSFYQPTQFQWQPTLFQPVGGMDMVWKGLINGIASLQNSSIEDVVSLNAPVTQINTLSNGVEVFYSQNGQEFRVTADYCISNIPTPVLKNIPANFSSDFTDAINRIGFDPTCKVGWQANQRFWETDRYEMYGGISWIDNLITQMWYPSNGFFSQTGTLIGAYNFGERALAMGAMPLSERLYVARSGALKLHPEFADNNIIPEQLGLSISWQHVPYQLGGWAHSRDTQEYRDAYARLLAPDGNGRFFVVGDQVSTLPGWQEGAMMSAEHVVEQMANRRSKSVPKILKAPDSKLLTEGR